MVRLDALPSVGWSASPRRGRWRGVAWVAILGGMAILGGGCDLDWAERAQANYTRAEAALVEQRYREAKALYEAALRDNPYHLGANYALARLLETRFLDEGGASILYQRYLTLPDGAEARREAARQRGAVLRRMYDGMLEDPVDATEDVLWSVERGDRGTWLARLHPALIEAVATREKVDPEGYRNRLRDRFAGKEATPIARHLVFDDQGGCSRAYVMVALGPPGQPESFWQMVFVLTPEHPAWWRLADLRRIEIDA